MKQTAHLFSLVVSAAIAFSSVTPALAAAPDGAGPWADTVVSFSQGLTKDGNPVPAARSNPTAALGVAENDTVDSHFVSLGFGGILTLGFDNGISTGAFVVEATNPNYPGEKANVEISENGTTWFAAGTITQDGSVSLPKEITCGKYVRLTDVSNKADFTDGTADGFDVDGVRAEGTSCTPPPTAGGNCDTSITQINKTFSNVTILSSANTGKNKAKKNTGGSTTITTGDATNTAIVSVSGGANIISGSGCCCCGGTTNVTISGNGAGSFNQVIIGGRTAKKFQFN